MRYLVIFLVALLFSSCKEESKEEEGSKTKPKLVLGVVVDQMRYEMLDRFKPYFGDGGFNRLRREGFEYKNHYYNYGQTNTGPGHATIVTGCTPSIHGIGGNSWFSQEKGRQYYCVEDGKSFLVGSNGIDSSKTRSPDNLVTETIGDRFKIEFGSKSRVVGVSLKDRAANLSTGKSGDLALWMQNDGKWGSSTWFTSALPSWVNNYNEEGALSTYKDSIWKPLREYPVALPDHALNERAFKGLKAAVFPYDFSSIVEVGGYSTLWNSPFGNRESREFFEEVLAQLNLGADDVPDFATLSFSSPDKIGHAFGPYSQELADSYIRLDKEIETLLRFLDMHVGHGEYLVYLTADHGVCNIPNRIDSVNHGGGLIKPKDFLNGLDSVLSSNFGIGLGLVRFYSRNIVIDRSVLEEQGLSYNDVLKVCLDYGKTIKGVERVVKLNELNPQDEIEMILSAGVYPGRSGDLFFLPKPGWLFNYGSGTDHGTPHVYDRHVPLIWFGGGVKSGSSSEEVYVTQIAPTISAIMGLDKPNGSLYEPLKDF